VRSSGRKAAAIAIALALGAALVLALAVASPGSGGVSANATCNTTLAQAASAGASSILVVSTTGCDIGDSIVLNQGGGTEECQEIEYVGALAPALDLVGTLAYGHSQGETVVEVAVCPTPTPTETETPPPTETPTPTPTPTLTPTPTPAPPNQMYNCPQAGRWALAAWQGADTDASEALATCGEGAVAAAYALDPSSGEWLRSFPDRPEISNLSRFENMQGFFALGSATASPTPTVKLVPPEAGQMRGCPLPGMWSIAVWDGPEASEADAALDTCGVWQADVAYSLDPETGSWTGWFRGRPELSTLQRWSYPQAAVVLGVLGTSDLIAFDSDRDGNEEIYVMNADGTVETRITNNSHRDRDPAWSPDGTKVAFASSRYDNWEIFVMTANGTMQANLTNNPSDDFSPAWSPDGARIAFTSDRDGNDEIYVMYADGTGQARRTNNAASDDKPAWSPDGSKIAFQSNRDGNNEVYVMNANGTVQANATLNGAGDGSPAWSPDGTKIAFISDRDGYGAIYAMNADGTGQTKLNPGTNWHPSEPAWSPDGTKIAFRSDWNPVNQDIYVINADGTGKDRLTTHDGWDKCPAWSP
jgi:Tol biopolymer transport system component